MLTDTWIDTHCHIHDMDDSDELFNRSKTEGVEPIICIGTDARTSIQASKMSANNSKSIYYSVGLHPHEGTSGLDDVIAIAYDSHRNNRNGLVAIGECGLDYYYEHSPRDAQRESFARQIQLADELDLALSIHTRNAWDDTLQILQSETNNPRVVIHCFTGGVDEARRCLDLGFYLSFSGIVTFNKSVDIQEAARYCPSDRMLLETDSPYLAPVPLRGSINEPKNISVIGSYISELKGMQVNELKALISKTTREVFRLK